jgi:hypothetical protein
VTGSSAPTRYRPTSGTPFLFGRERLPGTQNGVDLGDDPGLAQNMQFRDVAFVAHGGEVCCFRRLMRYGRVRCGDPTPTGAEKVVCPLTS